MDEGQALVGNDKPTTRERTIYRVAIVLLVLLSIALIIALIVIHAKEHNNDAEHESHLHRFFHISDTHLDLFYDPTIAVKNGFCRSISLKGGSPNPKAESVAKYGRDKCDLPRITIEEAATRMKKVYNDMDDKAEFVLMTGDQSGHDYSEFITPDTTTNTIMQSLGNSSSIIGNAITDIPVYFAFGNNDEPNHNLPVTENVAAFYSKIRMMWEPLITRGNTDAKFVETFRASFDQDGKTVLIILHTMYWSYKAIRQDAKVTKIGDEQMNWFIQQLKTAKEDGKKVIVAGHIPPGVDKFVTKPAFISNYSSIYMKQTTQDYKDIITAQLYGHTHSDQWYIQTVTDTFPKTEGASSFMLTMPGLTPVYSENPSFRLIEYDSKKQRLMNFKQFYMDLSLSNALEKPIWDVDYNLSEEYNIKNGLTASVVESVLRKLLDPEDHGVTVSNYFRHYRSRFDGDMKLRYMEYCGGIYQTEASFKECMKYYNNGLF
ncbi:acid sphingomyelinase-like phosphodiesterase 3b isoform X2 [Hydractinia symbiolongicarpus]|uniref:acid sphingomyelinase-like phosphodiesterase 3b isoform X2 n=1 Tax=Hydractinia symbiolongicarpus TaxID=13093 RepID=UPI00254C3BC2|nr:acid sphingomyelinase-like phosphodiesterase 3b isoform X2 [Hydractinia symbiolongicarpus]